MDKNFIPHARHWLAAHPRHTAILLMLVSTAAFSLMNALVRMVGEHLPAPLVVTLRNVLTLMLILPYVLRYGITSLRTKRFHEHVRRSFVGAFGMVLWTYAIAHMPLVHATALSFTAPLFATVFAILVLKEQSSPRQWVALGIGFVGTLITLRPGTDFNWMSLVVILATTAWAMASVLVKSLSDTEPPMRMVFYMNLLMFAISAPWGFSVWQMPTVGEWWLLLGIAACSVVMHFTLVSAYARAPVVTLLPLDFTRLIYATLLGYLFFGETTDWVTCVGAAVILVGAVLGSRPSARVEG